MNRGVKSGAVNFEKSKGFAEEFAQATVHQRTEVVRVSRIDKTRQRADREITMHIEKTGIRTEHLSAMSQIAGVEHKMGNLERELQDWGEGFANAKE